MHRQEQLTQAATVILLPISACMSIEIIPNKSYTHGISEKREE